MRAVLPTCCASRSRVPNIRDTPRSAERRSMCRLPSAYDSTRAARPGTPRRPMLAQAPSPPVNASNATAGAHADAAGASAVEGRRLAGEKSDASSASRSQRAAWARDRSRSPRARAHKKRVARDTASGLGTARRLSKIGPGQPTERFPSRQRRSRLGDRGAGSCQEVGVAGPEHAGERGLGPQTPSFPGTPHEA